MTPKPFMTTEEIAFLERGLTSQDRVWEWGSGDSTAWVAERCKYVTSVEHQKAFAMSTIEKVPDNASVLYIPPDFPYVEGTEDDGDLETFRRYTQSYTGKDIDVVIFDGRARLWCARQVAENSAYGPHPEMKFYLHDCEREQYSRIWKDNPGVWGKSWFKEVERVGNLVRLEVRE